MSNTITKQSYAQVFANSQIDIAGLQGAKATPADMTAEELLKLRQEKEFGEWKPVMLSSHSMKADLYASATGSGISVVSENVRLLTDEEISGANGFTDSQFIQNFVMKESFYKDQINSSYSGDELKAKMQEFDAVSSQVIESLANKFASGVGDFFNGTQDWLRDGKPTASAAEPYFDETAFKANILDIVEKSRTALEDIKRENPEKWADMLLTGGSNGSFFIQELTQVAGRMKAGSASGIEKMGYGDVVAVSQAIGSLGKGIYTNSSAMLAAYLGQEKMESELAASHFPMTDGVRQEFLNTVDRNIQTKISSYKATWERGLDDPKKEKQFNEEFGEMYRSFSGLLGADADDFRTGYAHGLKMLYDRLTEQPGTPESPKINQQNMAKGSLGMLVQDWNDFLGRIGQSGGGYAVPGMVGNMVDVTL
jgi:hypothetical protein